MEKVIVRKKPLTRQDLADPHDNMAHKQRLINVNAIDLKDNYIVETLKSGYWQIKPINTSKTIK